MRLRVEHALPLAALTLLAACGGGGSVRPEDIPVVPTNGPAADYPMVLGSSFTVDGVTYTPADTMNYDAVGYAALGSEGGAAVSAAHRTLPLPSYVEVTALDTGKTILVRVERRGPMSGKNLIELSPGAAAQLGNVGGSQISVRVRRVNPVETDRAALRSGQPAAARMDTPKSLLAVLQRKLDAQEGIVRPAPTAEPSPEPSPAAALPPKPEPKAKMPTPVKLEPKPKAEPKPKPEPQPKPEPKVKPPVPAPTIAAKPAAKPEPVAKPAVSGEKGRYFIQVGAFSSKANADSSAKKVGGSASASGKLWRVRTGPFASEADAKAALAKAKSAGYSDARIQHAD
ncbi:MAG: SPOR domain-containing protein [Novosphingobium sp.]